MRLPEQSGRSARGVRRAHALRDTGERAAAVAIEVLCGSANAYTVLPFNVAEVGAELRLQASARRGVRALERHLATGS